MKLIGIECEGPKGEDRFASSSQMRYFNPEQIAYVQDENKRYPSREPRCVIVLSDGREFYVRGRVGKLLVMLRGKK